MIINLKSKTDLSGIYVVYNGSTNLEKAGWYGLSHLMEHLMCKTFDHLQEQFDQDGIDWNAYTSDNEIVFYLTGLDKKIKKWKYKFVELLGNFTITEEQLENEKKIVLEEYMDSFNSQVDSHFLNLSRKKLGHYSPIGLRKDIENTTLQDCKDFFDLQYARPSKIINVSGESKFKADVEFATTVIQPTYTFGDYAVDLELGNEFKDKSSVILLTPTIEEDFAHVHLINSMLGAGLNSPLYQEVREKRGLCYYISAYQSRMFDKGLVSISTLTSNQNVEQVVDVVKMVLENPDKYLTKERLNTIVENLKVRKKKAKINRYNNVNKWINPEGWSVNDIIKDVKLDELREVYEKYYNVNDLYISYDKKEFLKPSNIRDISQTPLEKIESIIG
jgi:predicted Zn-dependent peptidase